VTALHASVLLPFLFAAAVPFLYRVARPVHTGWFVLPVPLILFGFFLQYIPTVSAEATSASVPWIAALGIHFTVYLDGLSLLFALLITGIGCLVVLYSIFYLSREREALHNFYVYLLLFMGAMLGVVLSDHLLVLYTFWEITSFSSFFLIAYWFERRKSRQGAMKSLLITLTGGFAMLLGLLMLGHAAGSYSIRDIIAAGPFGAGGIYGSSGAGSAADAAANAAAGMTAAGAAGAALADHALFLPAMILILLGAFAKSAQFPFHIWLPDAMEAPTPISAYLHSATMVKAGVYLVARLTPVFGGAAEWTWIILSVGLATLFWGSFLAIRQIDLKAMLAFSTVSQLGLIMCLLGIGSAALRPGMPAGETMLFSAAVLAAVFHLLNHSVFKGCLFMVVGILDHELGTRDIRKLGGLIRYMPVSFTLMMIGAFSMAGLPPFSGYLSKEMFFAGVLGVLEGRAALDAGWWTAIVPLLAWIASIFTFIYSLTLIFRTFTGRLQPALLDKPPHEAPPGMLIPPVVLGALALVFFAAPNALAQAILEPSVRAVLPILPVGEGEDGLHISAWHGWASAELWMTVGVVLFGIFLYRNMNRWILIYNYLPAKWSFNRLFELGLAGMERVSMRVTRIYMTGFTGHYFGYIFVFLVLLAGTALIALDAVRFNFSGQAPVHWFEAVLGAALVASAVYLVYSRQRLVSIIVLSAVGFLVSLLFVNFRAPDLALTQFAVETISTCLFLLCFFFLPKMTERGAAGKSATGAAPTVASARPAEGTASRLRPARIDWPRLLISAGVGTVLTLIGLSAIGHRPFETISRYYENAFELAGARNIVNAIIVDFRGFDTMLEIVVLFMAGLGVYTLIKLRGTGSRVSGGGSGQKALKPEDRTLDIQE